MNSFSVCTYYFLLHYPTRDMQIGYKLTFSYPNNFSYSNVFENQEVPRCSDNRRSTVHMYKVTRYNKLELYALLSI